MSVGAGRVSTHDTPQASQILNQMSQPVVVRNMEWLGSLGLLGEQRWIILRFKSRYNQLFFSRLLYVLIDCGNWRLETLQVIAGFSVYSTNTCFKTRSSSAEPWVNQQNWHGIELTNECEWFIPVFSVLRAANP